MISIGTDLVHISAFAEQLAQPGSSFMEVFSAGERRKANERQASRYAEHLAGRWAAKESFIKAWSQAIYGQPPVIAEEAVVWRDIEVRADAWGASRSNWRPNWPQWSGNPSGSFPAA